MVVLVLGLVQFSYGKPHHASHGNEHHQGGDAPKSGGNGKNAASQAAGVAGKVLEPIGTANDMVTTAQDAVNPFNMVNNMVHGQPPVNPVKTIGTEIKLGKHLFG